MIQNRSNSRIQKLKKRDVSRVETRREIEAKLTQHFLEILNEDGGGRGRDIKQITSLIHMAITRENNEMLTKPVAM